MVGRRGFCAGMLAAVLGTAAAGALAEEADAEAPTDALEVFADNGVALRGYDVVSYFTDSRAQAGQPTFVAEWGGVEWRFVSAANRDAFVATPEAYVPQYGGFCAWTMAQGYRAPTNPHAWAIVEGRLYLNSSTRVHRRWMRDMAENIAQADEHWAAMAE